MQDGGRKPDGPPLDLLPRESPACRRFSQENQ